MIDQNELERLTNPREALEEAFRTVFPPPPNAHLGIDVPALEAHTQIVRRFRRFLDAEAWTDAAMMLVPEGFDWSMDNFDGELGKPSAWICKGGPFFNGTGDHPALAIAQAALRAQEAGDV